MISDARKVAYDASNPILFDANVWLSLYAPPSGGNDPWAAAYSAVLKRIVECNVPVLIDTTVLGEYINRYCRIEFQAYEDYAHPNSKRSFKEFRTQDLATYRPIATDVASRVKEMFEIPGIKRINGDFAAMDVPDMLNEFAQGNSDWNDQLIVDICQRNACSLLTNDADFENASINILTCNSKLLRTVKGKMGGGMSEAANKAEARRPPIPAELRRRVLVEAGHRCAIPQCRSLVGVDLHHIVPWATCRKHEYENLIALCPNCHRMADSGTIDRKALRMYKQNLRSAHDEFSRFEVDLLFECYQKRGSCIPWPRFLLVLINRILELKYVDVRAGNVGINIGGLDNSPVYLSINDSGVSYIESLMHDSSLL